MRIGGSGYRRNASAMHKRTDSSFWMSSYVGVLSSSPKTFVDVGLDPLEQFRLFAPNKTSPT